MGGPPPGLGTLRSLREADPALNLVAADINPLAGGLFEPGATGLVLPSAGDADAYRTAVRATCSRHGLDTIIPGSEAEMAALAPVARLARFMNALLGIVLIFSPMVTGASFGALAVSILFGLALIGLSIPRGTVNSSYGTWDRFVR